MSWWYPFRSRLGLLNFLLLQWFFIRLQQVLEDDAKTHLRWELLTGPVPLTGWWSDYHFLWKKKLDFHWRRSA
jgi:hypothetical protein